MLPKSFTPPNAIVDCNFNKELRVGVTVRADRIQPATPTSTSNNVLTISQSEGSITLLSLPPVKPTIETYNSILVSDKLLEVDRNIFFK